MDVRGVGHGCACGSTVEFKRDECLVGAQFPKSGRGAQAVGERPVVGLGRQVVAHLAERLICIHSRIAAVTAGQYPEGQWKKAED
jgi:hypothetical protein